MKRQVIIFFMLTGFGLFSSMAQVVELTNTIDVKIQDQSTEIVNLYAFEQEGTFNLALPAVLDSSTFVVSGSHTITAGDIICFQDSSFFMQAFCLSVDVDTITIDTPFDYPFSVNGGCSYGNSNLNVNGSVTKRYFSVGPGKLNDNVSWDITRMIILITDNVAMDDGKFGGITALTKGIVFRVQDGITKNIFNVKTNGDFRLQAYDLNYVDATLGPSGQYSLGVRRSFNGFDKNGVVVRLNAKTDDKFIIIIQDNLSNLTKFNVIFQGHVTSY